MTTPRQPDPPPPTPAFEAALAAYSDHEHGRPLPPPAGFADRVSARALSRLRRDRWAGRGLATLVVLGLATAGYVGWRLTPTGTPLTNGIAAPVGPGEPEPAGPKLGDTLSEAGEALASITQTTTDKAVVPTRSLLAGADWAWRSAPKPAAPQVGPAADGLSAVPAAARSSVEPLASNTRKAINLFLRDTGLRASN